MLKISKELFLEQAQHTLGILFDQQTALPQVNLAQLNQAATALIVVDMVNGFVHKGPLASPRVAAIVPEVVKLARRFAELALPIVMFADAHPVESPEFQTYLPHCLEGSEESEIISELKAVNGYQLIPKNSTNGFLEPAFQAWLQNNPDIKHFVIVGNCTDICIEQFAKTLQSHFNRLNQQVRIIIPANAVATFDFELHNGNLLQLLTMYTLQCAGINVVAELA